MFSLRLRFRAIASKIQVLDLTAEDLNDGKKLYSIAKEYLPKRLDFAINQRQDLEDLANLWEILGIDAVIAIENEEGKLVRVGISLLDNEGKAQNIFYDLKGKKRTLVRQELGIEQYWVIVVKPKSFPDQEEWIDILYGEIDQPPPASDCRLIIL
jgi:hypothetical protein